MKDHPNDEDVKQAYIQFLEERAEQEKERSERYKRKLESLGVNPDEDVHQRRNSKKIKNNKFLFHRWVTGDVCKKIVYSQFPF
jgi:hypothetical protein